LKQQFDAKLEKLKKRKLEQFNAKLEKLKKRKLEKVQLKGLRTCKKIKIKQSKGQKI
jgi:hypothetical protein